MPVSHLHVIGSAPAVRLLRGGVPWWQPQARSQPREGTPTRAIATSSADHVAFVALVCFTLILLLSPQTWFPALKMVRIALLTAGVAIAAHVVDRTIRRAGTARLAPEVAIALALVSWAVLTVPLSAWPGGSVRVLVDHYLKAIAFFWLIGILAVTSARLRVLAWTLVLCSIPLSVTGILNYLSGGQLSTGVRGFTRIEGYMGGAGLTSNPNDLALMLNLIIPLAGVLVYLTRGVNRAVAASALLLSAAAVILTFSRAGFLTLAASFVMFLAVLLRRQAPGAAIGLLLVAVCVPPLLPDGYAARLNTITNMSEDRTGSAQGRWKDTLVAADLVAKSPLIGVGIGQDVLAMNKERGDTWRQVHNAYLEYGVDLGIPGMLLFIWLHLLCFRTARRVEAEASRDPAHRDLALLAAGVQVSLVAFAVAAMFHPIAYQFYFYSIAGLAVGLRHAWQAESRMTLLARSVR